jgi:hypothetical protein
MCSDLYMLPVVSVGSNTMIAMFCKFLRTPFGELMLFSSSLNKIFIRDDFEQVS